jgi:A/G-specific adenine glycosylase
MDAPYHIWVAEVMLQQTRVDTVVPYYRQFLARFPTVHALAEAPLDDVLKVWEGMGYYARARNLHAAAKVIVEELDGEIPDAWDRLIRLPGIGPYTAGAILSIAFGQRVPAVDGNARRVLSRLFAIESPIDEGRTPRQLRELARELVPTEDPGRFNQALMDLGATVCTPQKPACRLCPVGEFCEAYQRGLQDVLPATTKRKPTPHYDVTAGVIWDGHGRLLIAQRPPDGLLGGLWEFPGGKQEPGESLELCLRREIQEELGIEISVGEPIASVDHAYTHFRITLHAFHCTHVAGEPQALGCAGWRWVRLEELDRFAFPKADREVIEALRVANRQATFEIR